MKWLNKAVFSLILLMLVSGCSATTEDTIQRTYQLFSDSFQEQAKEANTTTSQVELYLPRGMEIEEEAEYNLVLKKGERLYILFFNPQEPPDSEINANRDKEVTEGRLLFETIEHEGKLGYVSIVEQGDEWKLVAGIGGAKITTITDMKHATDDMEHIVNILHSLHYLES